MDCGKCDLTILNQYNVNALMLAAMYIHPEIIIEIINYMHKHMGIKYSEKMIGAYVNTLSNAGTTACQLLKMSCINFYKTDNPSSTQVPYFQDAISILSYYNKQY